MTAQLHSLPRSGAGGSPPLVPAEADVRDAPDFRFNIARMLDSDWYHSCSKDEALAGINLHARAIHQVPAGSLPSSDNLLSRLADYGRDVEGWLEVKAKALEGWVLCTDGRWYQPDVARNALHIWIGRLEKRRASAYANAKQRPDLDFSLDEIREGIVSAQSALRAIDPQDPVLRESISRLAKWDSSQQKLTLISSNEEPGEDQTPCRTPTRTPTRTPLDGPPQDSVAKRSSKESSPDFQSGDSRLPEKSIQREFDEAEARAPPAPVVLADDDPGKPWPPDAVARFKVAYPRKKSWGAAEKALEKIRRSKTVSFAVLMAGVERFNREKSPDPGFWPYPATWLNRKSWEDGTDPPAPPRGRPPPESSRPRRNLRLAAADELLEQLHDRPR